MGFKEYLNIVLICMAQFGVQFSYSIEFSLGGPLFQSALHLKSTDIQIIFATVGPMIGLIAQPIIGSWSDRCHFRFGKRRIFILAGAIIACIGMVLIAVCTLLGELCGDEKSGVTASDHVFGIIYSLVGFFLMNLGVNIIQGPSRALVSDLIPHELQQTANLILTAIMGAAAVICNVAGALMSLYVSDFYIYMFATATVVVAISVLPTLIFGKEQPSEQTSDDNLLKTFGNVFLDIGIAFIKIPWRMAIVLFILFMGWLAYTPYMVNITNFFGIDIYHGTTDGGDEGLETYNKGVAMGMYGVAIFSFMQSVSAVIFPLITPFIGEITTFIGTHVLAFISYGLFYVVYWASPNGQEPMVADIVLAYTLMGIIALSFTQLNSLPYAMMKKVVSPEKFGVYVGVMNSGTVVAQTIINVAMMGILSFFDGYVAAIMTSCIICVITTLCSILLYLANRGISDNTHNTSVSDNDDDLRINNKGFDNNDDNISSSQKEKRNKKETDYEKQRLIDGDD